MKNLLNAFILIFANILAASGININKKHVGAIQKTAQALTLTDEQIATYCQEYIDWMDAHNPVCKTTDEDAGKKAVADRLEKIKASMPTTDVKLDIQAYYVIDQNAFACANGSIRVFSGLMKLMTDDEVLGIIGHEVGHLIHKDTKDAFKKALLTSALKDVIGSTSVTAAALTDSQLGSLGEALAKAQFSQKAEYAADDYGYEFLKKNGKDSMGMVTALRVIQKLSDDAGADKSKVNQLFSTHPESGKRADKLESKYKEENEK
jgi:putative metalloprotease